MNRHTPLSALFSDSMPRRTFLKAAILAGTARFFSTQTKVAGGSTTTAGNDGTLNRLTGRNTDLNHHILLKGGTIITMDPVIGDFAKGDLLIQGKKIIAVGPNVKAPPQTHVIDASNTIVFPGFVDCHRHAWEGQLRRIIPNATTLADYMG